MTPALTGARSGLALAAAEVGTAAHNTANLLTESAPRMRASGVAQPTGGVSVQISTSARAGADPVADVVSLERGELLYRANLQVIAAEDERLGATVDLLG